MSDQQINPRRLVTVCGVFFFIVLGSPLYATNSDDSVAKARTLNLAQHPTWRKLLHYESSDPSSVIITDGFFLSPQGRRDPQAELTATLQAYFAPWTENPNVHARCRYPARYYWLSHQLKLPDYQLPDDHCSSLKKWRLYDEVESISVLLVSGYFGNPASTFGHALFKFNTNAPQDQTGFFDSTLSYGAMVPEGEFALRYVVRGLFGGYKAGFSDKYFYTQDLTYSRTEFRDIWDYELNLTDYERTFLLLHVWELVGSKFDYYFLDKNCAYRLAELLELVIDENIVDNGRFWFFPVEFFYRLKEIDAQWRQNQKKLVTSVRYVPSNQRVLYHHLKLLSVDELKRFNQILKDGSLLSTHLADVSDERKIVFLDSLLAYEQYKIVGEEPNPSQERKEFKDKILLERLHLPMRERESVPIPALQSPADGARPMVFGMMMAGEKNENPFLRINWAAFKEETIGDNSLEGDELVVFDLAVGVFEEEHKAFVDQFDLLRILNLNTSPLKIHEESQLSWQLRIGMDRIERHQENRYDGIVSFGAGPARKINDVLTAYALMEIGGHSLAPYVRLRSHMGLRWEFGALRAWIYGGGETTNYDAKPKEILGGKMQYHFNDRSALRLEISNEVATRGSLGVNWYW